MLYKILWVVFCVAHCVCTMASDDYSESPIGICYSTLLALGVMFQMIFG